jgi:phosphoenolpyruvate phosphomutase
MIVLSRPPNVLGRLLSEDRVHLVAGAHDALGARLAERHGFDAVWAGGLGISAAHGVPDDSILTMTEFLEAAIVMSEACGLPVVADCDTGFGGLDQVRRMAQKYEAGGIAGVCIEDKVFPKHNSLGDGQQELEPIESFCEKVAAAKAETSAEFVVIARTEALIASLGQDEALRRGEAYREAGADVLLIHSRAPKPTELLEFGRRWGRRLPLAAVPTTYPAVTREELHSVGVSLCIYANQALRAAARAMDDVLETLIHTDSAEVVEERIWPLSHIFELQTAHDA